MIRITEYLDVELETRTWHCNRCGEALGAADEPYKKGCVVRERDPREIHPPLGTDDDFNFSFHPDWIRIIEFYCPGCGAMIENEYLPPGHPLTWDIQLDLEALAQNQAAAKQDGEAS